MAVNHIKTTQDDMREANARIQTIVARARQEDREFTDAEKVETEALVARMTALDGKRRRTENLDDLLTHVRGLTADAGAVIASVGPAGRPGWTLPAEGASVGDAFVQSASFQAIAARLPYDGGWRTPPLNVKYDIRAALLEPAGGWVPMVQVPAPAPLRVPHVAGLFAQARVTSGSIGFLQDSGQPDAAAPVAQGALKPELALTLPQITMPVATIAVWTSTSVQALEDADGLRDFINSILMADVLDRLDQQVIAGTGVSPEMLGVLATTGIGTITATAGTIAPDAILAAIAKVQADSGLAADAVVMNPADFGAVLALKAAPGGQYLTGQPMTATPVATMWGLRVLTSPSVPAGVVIVGAFGRAAILYTRNGVRVEASTEHGDFFTKNLVAIRAEIRGALAVLRPRGFVKLTLAA